MKENLYTCDNPECGKTATFDKADGWFQLSENQSLDLYMIKPAKSMSVPQKAFGERHFCCLKCLTAFIEQTVLAQIPKPR